MGSGRWLDCAGLGAFLGCACRGMVFVLLVLLFVIFECAGVEIAGTFGVPITLKLNTAEVKSEEGKRGVAHTLIARSTMVTTSSEPY